MKNKKEWKDCENCYMLFEKLSMHTDYKQSWLFPKNIQEAKQAQQEMAKLVVREDILPKTITKIAGVDISNTPFDPMQMVFGSIVIISYPALTVLESVAHAQQQKFPYIPGLLGFREIPTLLEAYQKLSMRPDLIMVDGHGISHPRGLGIASHLGVLLDIPTIGIAKSILVGAPQGPLSEEIGSQIPLQWQGKEIGTCLRTKKRCRPLIISAGHKISLQTAVKWTLLCLKQYRLVEPTRHAHFAANVCRKEYLTQSI